MIGFRAVVSVVAFLISPAAFAAPAGLNADCLRQYDLYVSKPAPKAFAVSSNGYCGWAWRSVSSPAEFEKAKNMALGYCMQYAGTKCQVVETVK